MMDIVNHRLKFGYHIVQSTMLFVIQRDLKFEVGHLATHGYNPKVGLYSIKRPHKE